MTEGITGRCAVKLRVALLSAVAAIAVAAPDSAPAVQRTFVASTGNDANPCSLTLPCRGFAAAVGAVGAGGEVIVLDSAGYGPFTVAKSVSIIAPAGVYAGVTVFAGDGVVVNAGANDKVVLRGLTINGQGGNRGIHVAAGGEVHIEQCIATNLLSHGINVGLDIGQTTQVHIRGAVIRDNGDAGLAVNGGSPKVHVADSHLSGNYWGVWMTGGMLVAERIVIDASVGPGFWVDVGGTSAVVTVSDSSLSGNGGAGAYLLPDGQFTTARMAISRSVIARNGLHGVGAATYGAGGTAFLTVSDSSVVENGGYGISVSGSNAIGVVTGSTVAGNSSFDLAQVDPAELRSSTNNTLTGRGAADVNGTLTPNPMR